MASETRKSVPMLVSSATIEIVKANVISTFIACGWEYDDEVVSEMVKKFAMRQSNIIHAMNEFKQSMA